DVGPEPGAVLAQPPALVLDAALALGDLELALALAGAHVLLGIEGREVAPDDLRRAVALDALRAQVPGRDVPARVEHEDRVLAHALDQATEQGVARGAAAAAGLQLGGQARLAMAELAGVE